MRPKIGSHMAIEGLLLEVVPREEWCTECALFSDRKRCPGSGKYACGWISHEKELNIKFINPNNKEKP